MVAVHTFVAEVLAYLIDTLETAHDQALQIEFSSDTHIHILIQGIEMRDERTGGSTACNHLQGRRLNLSITSFIKHLAEGADDGSTLQESVLHTVVYHQVDIALAIAQLRIVEFIIGHTVLVFHDGQGFQTL